MDLKLAGPLIAVQNTEETLDEFQSLLQIYVLRCLLGKFSMRIFQDFDDIDVDTLEDD